METHVYHGRKLGKDRKDQSIDFVGRCILNHSFLCLFSKSIASTLDDDRLKMGDRNLDEGNIDFCMFNTGTIKTTC